MLDFLSSLGLITWDFDPALIRIGGFELRYYGILFAAALAGGYFMLRWRYKDENEDPETATNLTYAMMIAVIVGTRLVHCLFYDPEFYLAHPIEILKFWKGGLASHGAAVGIILTCILYDYVVRKTPCRITLDRMAFTIPFAMVCIRLGNFFNSEIVGAPCDPNSPLAFIFTRYDMIPRYPSQLFEAGMGLIAGLVIFGTYFYYKKRKNDRMGLVVFSTNSIIKSPATTNTDLLKRIISKIEIKQIKTEKVKPTSNKFEYINFEWWQGFNDDNLNKYIIQAIENNKDLKVASLTIEEFYQNIVAQRASQLPQINAGFLPGYSDFGTGAADAYAFPIMASYEIDIFGKNSNKTDSVRKLWESSILDEKSAHIAIASAVGSSYLNIVKLDALISLQEDIVKLRKDIFKMMEILKQIC